MTGEAKLVGVAGWPIKHSLSPLIHSVWANRAGINGYYLPLAIPPSYDEFARAIDALVTIGFKGVNVTLPHKEHALRYSDASSETATKTGAANMLTFNNNGSYAENSDIEGFSNALKGLVGRPSKKHAAFILGAGGAARGIAIALKEHGFSKLYIANRTTEKATTIASELDLSVINWEHRNEVLPDTDLLVNTTSLGMTDQPPLEIAVDKLKSGAAVADIVYTPLETPLLKTARQHDVKTADGLSMLMHQSAPGFRTWFGGEAVVDNALRETLVTELARRGQE